MKKEKIEIIATVVLAVIFLVFLFVTMKKGSKNKAPSPAKVIKGGETIRKPSVRPQPQGDKKVVQDLGWGRDPFVLVQTSSSGMSTSLNLGGILWDKKKPKAMINDNIYGVGDKIGEIEILDIKKDRVIVKEGDATRTIKLD